MLIIGRWVILNFFRHTLPRDATMWPDRRLLDLLKTEYPIQPAAPAPRHQGPEQQETQGSGLAGAIVRHHHLAVGREPEGAAGWVTDLLGSQADDRLRPLHRGHLIECAADIAGASCRWCPCALPLQYVR